MSLGGRAHLPDTEALQARFALRVASRLSESAEALPHDVTERLRVARERAVAHARASRRSQPAVARAPQVLSWGPAGAALGSSPTGWQRLASLMPLLMLLAGLMLIEHLHSQAEIHAAAEVDAALLADDLPPEAYGDPGFVVYLKQSEP